MKYFILLFFKLYFFHIVRDLIYPLPAPTPHPPPPKNEKEKVTYLKLAALGSKCWDHQSWMRFFFPSIVRMHGQEFQEEKNYQFWLLCTAHCFFSHGVGKEEIALSSSPLLSGEPYIILPPAFLNF